MKARNERKGTVNDPSGANVAALYVAITVASLLVTANSVLAAMLSVTLLSSVYAYCKRDKRTAKALYKSMLKIQSKVLDL